MTGPAPSPAALARAFPEGVPTLVDPAAGVTLRATTADDLPAIVEESRDPETVRWTTSVPTPPGGYALRDAEDFFARIRTGWTEGGNLTWTLEAERDGVRQHCGLVNLRPAEPGWAEIGFGLHPALAGRSIMSSPSGWSGTTASTWLGLEPSGGGRSRATGARGGSPPPRASSSTAPYGGCWCSAASDGTPGSPRSPGRIRAGRTSGLAPVDLRGERAGPAAVHRADDVPRSSRGAPTRGPGTG